jgi:hypothetical protein
MLLQTGAARTAASERIFAIAVEIIRNPVYPGALSSLPAYNNRPILWQKMKAAIAKVPECNCRKHIPGECCGSQPRMAGCVSCQ